MKDIKKQIEGLEKKLSELRAKAGGKNAQDDSSQSSFILGSFSGEAFVSDDGKVFNVNPNYASKSKLVQGDKMKMIFAENGKTMFKVIEPIEKKWAVGKIVDIRKPKVDVAGEVFSVLYSSVTFFKLDVGSRVSVIMPASGTFEWVAIDSLLP